MAPQANDDSSTDAWRRFCLLRDAHTYFLELTGLERLAAKLVMNFLRGGEFDPEGRRRYRLYEIDALPGGTAPSPYDGEFWCSYPERGIHCEIDCKHSSARWTGPVTAEWQAFDGRQKAEYNITLIWVCWGAVLDFLQGVGFLSGQSQSDPTRAKQLSSEQPQPDSTRAEHSSSEQSQPDSTGAEQSSPPEQPVSREEPQAEETSQESLEPERAQSDETPQEPPLSEPIHNNPTASESLVEPRANIVAAPAVTLLSMEQTSESPEPPIPRLKEMRHAGMLKGHRQKMAAEWALDEYPPDGNIPEELTASEMRDKIQQWRKCKGKPMLADEALLRFCVRFLKAYRKKPSH